MKPPPSMSIFNAPESITPSHQVGSGWTFSLPWAADSVPSAPLVLESPVALESLEFRSLGSMIALDCSNWSETDYSSSKAASFSN